MGSRAFLTASFAVPLNSTDRMLVMTSMMFGPKLSATSLQKLDFSSGFLLSPKTLGIANANRRPILRRLGGAILTCVKQSDEASFALVATTPCVPRRPQYRIERARKFRVSRTAVRFVNHHFEPQRLVNFSLL